MYFLKINDNTYPAVFTGKMVDKDWDNRETKTITFEDITLQQVEEILQDDVEWHIYQPLTEVRQVFNEETEEIVPTTVDVSIDYDNSAFSIRGPITLYPDGKISVKMGKPTDLEEAYELLYGGIEE